MDCGQVGPLLYRLVEDRLLPDDADAVGKHLADCGACSSRAKQIAQIDEAAMTVEDEVPGPQLRRKLLDDYRGFVTRKPSARPSHRLRLTGFRRAAAIGLIVLGSSTTTWITVRSPKLALTEEAPSEPPRVSLDHVFPLLISNPYTVVYKDGRHRSGSRIHIVH